MVFRTRINRNKDFIDHSYACCVLFARCPEISEPFRFGLITVRVVFIIVREMVNSYMVALRACSFYSQNPESFPNFSEIFTNFSGKTPNSGSKRTQPKPSRSSDTSQEGWYLN
jgi:hypothetical protein